MFHVDEILHETQLQYILAEFLARELLIASRPLFGIHHFNTVPVIWNTGSNKLP